MGRVDFEVKKFKDPLVPGTHVKLSQLAVDIIDTKYFSRLRWLKQLGATDRVFPTATHTR